MGTSGSGVDVITDVKLPSSIFDNACFVGSFIDALSLSAMLLVIP